MVEATKKIENISILAIDTCTELCSVALSVGGKVYADRVDAPREHSQRLLPMVEQIFEQANIRLNDADLIAYGRGPGSFTGIRICSAMTQGLALGQDLPVIGISTLQTMAQAAMVKQQAMQVVAAIDARMGEVYCAEFICRDGLAILVGQERVCRPERVSRLLDYTQPVVACGTGFDTYPQLLTDNVGAVETLRFPEAEFMLPLAIDGYLAGAATDVDKLKPVYLRDSVTWKKLPGR